MFNNDKHKVVYGNNWVKVKESEDKFFYLERKGKNSIAILLYNDKGEVLVRFQPMCAVEKDGPSTNRLAPCPITGSIDDGEDYLETAIREAEEEAGYKVRDYIESTGDYIVSTQCNEICYTYIANVSSLTFDEPKGDGGYHESISYNKWVNIYEVFELENIYGGLIILANQVLSKMRKGNSSMKKIYEDLKKLSDESSLDKKTILDKDTILDEDTNKELSETIDKSMSFNDIVAELIDSWHKKGEIHGDKIASKDEAVKKATAIAFSIKGEDKK